MRTSTTRGHARWSAVIAVLVTLAGWFVAAPATAAEGSAARARAAHGYVITVHGWSRTIVRGDQRTINRCRATLWRGPTPAAGRRGTTWLAGHDYCGFWRWDRWLRPGATFTVRTPKGHVLTYRVTGRGSVARHGGSAAGLIHGDITLQTCHGSGTVFVYARVVARR